MCINKDDVDFAIGVLKEVFHNDMKNSWEAAPSTYYKILTNDDNN